MFATPVEKAYHEQLIIYVEVAVLNKAGSPKSLMNINKLRDICGFAVVKS